MKTTQILILLLLLSVTANLIQFKNSASSKEELKALRSDFQDLKETYEEALHRLEALEKNYKESELELNKTEAELKRVIATLTALNASISKQKEIIETLNFSRIVKAYILGVKTDTNTGIVLPLETKLEYGSGELLLDASNVSFTKDFQNTMRISLKVAQNFTGEEISKYNVIFHVSNPYNNTLTLTGSSAGTIMTVALIAALKNKTLKEGIMVTGGINENGEILSVAHVTKKALAAKEYGAKIILVPRGQKRFIEGIDLIEVRNISEVVDLILE
jgi:predicted ATP-dependent protease